MQIVVADPVPIVRAGLRLALASLCTPSEFVEAVDHADLTKALAGLAPGSLVVASADLPGAGAVAELCRLINRSEAYTVIMLPAPDPATAITALHSGAAGVVLKSSRAPVLCAAMQVVVIGGRYLCPSALMSDGARPDCVSCALGFVAARAEGNSAPETGALTARQREVLHLVGEGLSNKEIARQLGLKVGTVKIHVARILQVLNAPSRAKAMVLARRLAPDRRAARPGSPPQQRNA